MTEDNVEYVTIPSRKTSECRPFGDLPKSGLIRPTTSPFEPAPEEELATLEGRIVHGLAKPVMEMMYLYGISYHNATAVALHDIGYLQEEIGEHYMVSQSTISQAIRTAKRRMESRKHEIRADRERYQERH